MKKVKFIYNPNSGERRIAHELDKIIEVYQEYNYIVVPYRLCKSKPISDAFFDMEYRYLIWPDSYCDKIMICSFQKEWQNERK